MNELPTIQDVIAEIRQAGQSVSEQLRVMVRLQKQISQYTDRQLTEASLPAGWTLDANDNVLDDTGTIVPDYYPKPRDWAQVKAALAAFRAMHAILTNDSVMLSDPGIAGQDHWLALQRFLHWKYRGDL